MSFLSPSSHLLLLLSTLTTLTTAWAPPSYGGYTQLWSAPFPGAAGTSPSTANWNIITGYLNVNAELETYTASSRNLQISGGETLQIVPWHDASGWTSGRIESKYTFTPTAGKVTRAEADIRFGGNDVSTKAGIWPAFWMLGQSLREGGSWPACGELDVMETVNGALRGYGTAHCVSCIFFFCFFWGSFLGGLRHGGYGGIVSHGALEFHPTQHTCMTLTHDSTLLTLLFVCCDEIGNLSWRRLQRRHRHRKQHCHPRPELAYLARRVGPPVQQLADRDDQVVHGR